MQCEERCRKCREEENRTSTAELPPPHRSPENARMIAVRRIAINADYEEVGAHAATKVAVRVPIRAARHSIHTNTAEADARCARSGAARSGGH